MLFPPTGLTFHVHGYFMLDQNRRHIKLPGAEQDWDTVDDPSLLWNQFLVSQVLPKVLS